MINFLLQQSYRNDGTVNDYGVWSKVCFQNNDSDDSDFRFMEQRSASNKVIVMVMIMILVMYVTEFQN